MVKLGMVVKLHMVVTFCLVVGARLGDGLEASADHLDPFEVGRGPLVGDVDDPQVRAHRGGQREQRRCGRVYRRHARLVQ